ncbi:MAG: PIN domain nuclease [Chloroflexi bacterium]|nr:PIN domain nuclease [Chloroflexota bacterium]
MSVEFFLRLIGMIIFGYLGWLVSEALVGRNVPQELIPWVISMVLAGAALGLLVTPYLIIAPFRWVRGELKQIPANTLLAGTIGLIIGLIIAALVSLPMSLLPGNFGKFLPLVTAVMLSYLGIAIMVMREHDLRQAFASYFPSGAVLAPRNEGGEKIVLDTSAIIDGRIADISQTGFVRGTLVLPRFVLDELRHIADSPDPLRRNRGRRGLEMLNKLQKESDVPIEINDIDFDDVHEVDAKLIKLARSTRSPIITNDFNLNRVAELQGVRVLNINALANAVKSVVLPGEEMAVRIIQEGKEAGQGVGFLDDGTMVVVEGGRRYLNQIISIIVTRVLQTVAGRMIFAQPKLAE